MRGHHETDTGLSDRPDARSAEDEAEYQTHRRALEVLEDAGMRPMVGGAYALRVHTSLWRDTKDLDIFIGKDQVHRALALLEREGFETEFTDPLWIAKALQRPNFVDLIFSSGNGIAIVDDSWRARARTGVVLGIETLVVPVEEMIWSKGFIQERERFDGGDIHHLIRCAGAAIDWRHLLDRFAPHYQVLLSHLTMYRFAFPSDVAQVPSWVMEELIGRLQADESLPARAGRVCRGGLVSRQQYLHELRDLGYHDARIDEVSGWVDDSAYPVRRKA